MTERPILFSSAMVRAILDGRKTMTRRVVRPQPKVVHAIYSDASVDTNCIFRSGDQRIHCPYGVRGDRLWVREGWKCAWHSHYTPDPPGVEKAEYGIDYKANGMQAGYGNLSRTFTFPKPVAGAFPGKHDGWRPSIFMPRWASRITLELTGVKVERVREIGPEDCFAEGIDYDGEKDGPEAQYAVLWDKLNANRGLPWSSNPWVWCLTFRQLPLDNRPQGV